MNPLLATIELLASGADRLRGINQYMNREGGDPWSSLLFWLVGLGVGTTLLLIALRYARQQERHRSAGHPWRLFHQLLRPLPLTRDQRARLAQVARHVHPDCPASILLTPSGLAESIRRWGEHRPLALRATMADALAPAGQALFGEPEPGANAECQMPNAK